MNCDSAMDVRELKIKVPWGHIAAKAWGSEEDFPVIALHGWQDNASSFDKLIPLLPRSFYYVSLDLPSHGQSSHIPTPTFVTFNDFVLSLKLVLDELGRQTYVLLGHSFGAQTSLVFSQLFPEYVTKLIMLDATYYLPVYPSHFLNSLRHDIKRYYKAQNSSAETAPNYTHKELVERLMKNRFVPISEEGAKILLNRSLLPTADGRFKISTAQHLKYVQRPPLTVQYQKRLCVNNPIQCPHLIILASETIMLKEVSAPVIEEFRKNPHFQFTEVEGTHDVHLEHPERIAPILCKFLSSAFSKL